MNRFIRVLLFSLFLAPLSAMAQDFPRLGGIQIGSPHDYWDPAYQRQIARLDVAILSVYPGWGTTRSTDMIRTVQQIKALNPRVRIFLYVIGESILRPASSAWQELEAKVDREQWWLYNSGTSLVLSDYGRNTYVMNITNYSRADANGQRFNQWFPRYVAGQFATTNPGIDGFFTDNVFWKPRRDGDWNRDGRTDSNTDATVQRWYREGYRQYITTLKSAMPGKLQIANVADWGAPNAVLTEYQGQWNGGVLEAIIGASHSIETLSGGWQHMMARYRKTMGAFAEPKIGMFNQHGSATDYQGMRYGLASTLMDNGYYTFTDSSSEYRAIRWFDEFDANLGSAVSPPQTAAWQSGVFRRDFTNGIALVNPKGNGQRTVTLDGEYVLIRGTQAPTVNTGARVRQVTLRDRDGLILMRVNPVRRPAAPGAVQIETAAN